MLIANAEIHRKLLREPPGILRVEAVVALVSAIVRVVELEEHARGSAEQIARERIAARGEPL